MVLWLRMVKMNWGRLCTVQWRQGLQIASFRAQLWIGTQPRTSEWDISMDMDFWARSPFSLAPILYTLHPTLHFHFLNQPPRNAGGGVWNQQLIPDLCLRSNHDESEPGERSHVHTVARWFGGGVLSSSLLQSVCPYPQSRVSVLCFPEQRLASLCPWHSGKYNTGPKLITQLECRLPSAVCLQMGKARCREDPQCPPAE